MTEKPSVRYAHGGGLDAAAGAQREDVDLNGLSPAAFEEVGRLVRECRSIWTAVGKSGYAARLLAATGATSGLPTNWIHAEDLLHGELSTLRDNDVLIAISWRGETVQIQELFEKATFTKILITAADTSEIASLVNHVVACEHVADELLSGIPCESILETLRVGYKILEVATSPVERSFALQSGHPHGALSVLSRKGTP